MNLSLDELAAFAAVAKAAEPPFEEADVGFPEQDAFVDSAARRILACCSRRSGKTRSIARRLLRHARKAPFAPQVYVTLTRLNAKHIIWQDLLALNDEHHLGGKPNLSELVLHMPGGADIYLAGCNNEREIEKLRGKRFKGANVDEPQSIPDRILRPLINDALGPTLLDYQGYLALTGTPGAAPVGYFWEADQGTMAGRWERHHWTIRQNTRLPARVAGMPVEAILGDVLAEHGWTPDNATYQREYEGRWVHDVEALVFKYDAARNAYDVLPEGRWSYVLGVDIGFEDADAIAVLGWREHDPAVYVVEEYVRRKSSITELAERIQEAREKYQPVKIVADFGGLGKKIGDEIRRRFNLPVEAADKVRKFEHIELLNDALRTGKLKARPDGPFAEDARIVQWDQDARARGQLKIADDYHSDITDAVLYGFRAARGYRAEPTPPPPPDNDGARLEAERMERLERERSRDVWDNDADWLGFDQ